MEAEAFIGIGLGIMGIGGTITAAILRFGPKRNSNGCVTSKGCKKDMDAQKELFETKLEVVDEKISNVQTQLDTHGKSLASIEASTTAILKAVKIH